MGERIYRLTGDGAAEIEASAREIATMAVEEFARELAEHFDDPARSAVLAAASAFGAKRDGFVEDSAPYALPPVTLTFYPVTAGGDMYDARTLSLWTDGITFWAGWWSRDDRCVYVLNADGSSTPWDREKLAAEKITWWAKCPNLFRLGFPWPAKAPAKGGPPCTDPCSAQPGASPGETGRGDVAGEPVEWASHRYIANLEADNAALSRRVEQLEGVARDVHAGSVGGWARLVAALGEGET